MVPTTHFGIADQMVLQKRGFFSVRFCTGQSQLVICPSFYISRVGNISLLERSRNGERAEDPQEATNKALKGSVFFSQDRRFPHSELLCIFLGITTILFMLHIASQAYLTTFLMFMTATGSLVSRRHAKQGSRASSTSQP
jgi:hypothetical protein